MKSDKSPERVEETAPENEDMIPVHINRRDRQAAKAYVEGYNSGLETAAYVLENGNFLTSESLAYLWAHQVAALVRARKTLEPPEPAISAGSINGTYGPPAAQSVGEPCKHEVCEEDRSRPMTTNKSASPASSNPPTGINGGYDALNQLSREQKNEIEILHDDHRRLMAVLHKADAEVKELREVNKELKAEIAALKEGWIEIREGCRLPPDAEDGFPVEVMVYSPKYPRHHLGRYRKYDKTWTFSGSNSDFTSDITHWRPTPSAPGVSVTINTQHELYPNEFDVPGGVHKLEAEIIRLKAEIAALREANTVATSVADTLRREIQQLRDEAKNEKS